MLNFNEVRDNAQNGYHTADGLYHGAGENVNISTGVGYTHVYRFSTMVPVGATVTAASLRVHVGAKDGNSDQSVSYTLSMHASGNSAPLVENEYFLARNKYGSIARTVTFTQSTQTWSSYDTDVLSMIQNFMSRADYVPGAYITFALTITAESGDINLNVDNKPFGGEKPHLQITYTPASNGIHTDFNLMDNGSATTSTTYWGVNDAFGTFVTSGASWSIDNSMQRISGRPTIKFTPPSSNPDSKPAMFGHGVLLPGQSQNYIFCGWAYIPSAFTGTVYPQFMWEWDGSNPITARDQWVPFCCSPKNVWTNPAGVLPMLHISPPFTGSSSIWLSDCAVYVSDFRQMPFNTEKTDTKTVDYNYTWNSGRGTNTRIVKNEDGNVKGASVFAKARKYARRTDGIWMLTEGSRQGISWDDAEANGMTWDTLQAGGKTWDQLKAAETL